MSSEKSLTPQIRFKGFTEAWEQRKLGEVFEYLSSQVQASQAQKEGRYKLFDASSQIGYSNTGSNRPLVTIIKDGSGVGRIRLIPYNSWFIGTLGGLLANETDVDFGYALLQNIDFSIYIIGSTIPHIYFKDYSVAPLLIAKIKEQQMIGKVFSKLDSLITLHQRKLNTLKKIKSALLEKMFPKDGSNVPEIRFTGFTEAWEQRKLGDIAEIIGGGTPDTNNPSYWDGDIDWYSPAELGEQIYTIGSRRRITKEGYKNSSAKLLPANKTILFTSRAGIGTTAILCRSACTNQGFQSLVINDNTDLYFIYSMSSRIKDFAISKASGSTFLEISGKQLATMNLFLPQLNEQKKIGQYFKSLDYLITLHQRKLDALKKIKSALLEKMFV